MVKVSDRTIVGTIRNALSPGFQPHVGLRGGQRLQINLGRLYNFVRELPVIKIDIPPSRPVFFIKFARQMEKLFALPSDSIVITQKESRTYRKTTLLSQVNLYGTPWLLLKCFSENDINHESLRAMREKIGADTFGSFDGVEAPKIQSVFLLQGEWIPKVTVVVAETILPGMPALNFLEIAANSPNEKRNALIASMCDAFSMCSGMIARVHDQGISGIAIDVSQLRAEAEKIINDCLLCDQISIETVQAIKKALSKTSKKFDHGRMVLAHRDFTPNNLLYHQENNFVGIIDLEKSETEYAAKDWAKFTETVYIDGVSIGLTEKEIKKIQNTFIEAYLDASRISRSDFWQQLHFYQLYTLLGLTAYQLKRSDYVKCGLLIDRMKQIGDQ